MTLKLVYKESDNQLNAYGKGEIALIDGSFLFFSFYYFYLCHVTH